MFSDFQFIAADYNYPFLKKFEHFQFADNLAGVELLMSMFVPLKHCHSSMLLDFQLVSFLQVF